MTQPQQSREERLAAKLRENLRRRKAQARLMDGGGSDAAEAGPEGGATVDSGIENESGALPKSRPES